MAGYGKTKENTYIKECRVLDVNGLELEPGSGRITWSKNDGTVVDSLGYKYDGESLNLQYTVTTHNLFGESEKEDYNYDILIDWTRPNFGGKRPWFLCPAEGCGKRVGKLYKPPRGRVFACRHCYDLSYESQGKSNSSQYELIDRWEKKCRGILEKLEADSAPGMLNLPIHPEKPKGMHEEKYRELLMEYDRYYCKALNGLERWLGQLEGILAE